MTARCARCDWTPDPDIGWPQEQAVMHATQAGHQLCVSCRRSLTSTDPLRACETCLTDARSLLAGILVLWQELPRHLGHAPAQRYDHGPRGGDEHPLPGGTVFALLAPGSAGGAARKLTALDVERGADGREHRVDNQPDDTPSVAWTLTSWEDDWRHTRGEPAADLPPGSSSATVRAAAGYLERRARWAADSHPAFEEFHDDMRKLHARLEYSTGRVRKPVKAGADCFDCGGELVRPVTELGLEVENVVTCQRCGSTYDGARYLLALAARRQEGLDGWVPYRAAATAAKRPVATLWSWVQRLQVTAACKVTDRTVVVWYPDVDHRATTGRKTSRADVA